MTTKVERADVDTVARRCLSIFKDPTKLEAPPGYPRGLALCLIDAIQSAGVKYTTVVRVVDRYRTFRTSQGTDGDADGLPELLGTFDDLGVEGWMDRIGTRNRTPARPGAPYKAEAMRQTAVRLHEASIDTTKDVRAVAKDAERLAAAHNSWVGVIGQTSGVTWHYFLMLAGVPGVKPDRMIIRFLAEALGVRQGTISPDRARMLLTDAAEILQVSPTALDHGVWQYQRRANHGRA